ncbi:lipoate--protein ligase family protein [Enterococcus thailandicus]|uniref:lipoate--protein ligase family protein n=1 Tax=Enterococcus thailandicus TaxID=417368 RepID=UPI0022EBD6C4|nr:lipoate--protein ligase family protein [Enterococcus thailandicus]MDA3972993.1 lipoate--protein ligase family protein [Enterococcus thailandicus]MDA3975573.1 lipoate--protein ligase family protein [Enterococcus thailandicus]MDA3980453.1 lipoate--protein ligase family protein [Enterococcus thailandicus]
MNPPILLDQDIYQGNDFSPFALTDLLTAETKKQQQTFLHFWQYNKTVIFGMKDTRTPFFTEGVRSIREAGYTPVVRNSGGLGIVSDMGILNVSLLFPQTDDKKISIDDGYERMLALTRKAFPEAVIEAFEISDSYCPGTYDLSISGKKFAGIAQRRIKNGIAVMMYLSVTGNQLARGALMQAFYQTSLKEAFGTDGYPAVKPEKMANLSDLLQQQLTVSEVKIRLATAFQNLMGQSVPLIPLSSTDWLQNYISADEWETQLARMADRNSILKEQQYDNSL